jgi:hypothetical protein
MDFVHPECLEKHLNVIMNEFILDRFDRFCIIDVDGSTRSFSIWIITTCCTFTIFYFDEMVFKRY